MSILKDEELYMVQDDTEYLTPMPELSEEKQAELEEVSKNFIQKIKEEYGL